MSALKRYEIHREQDGIWTLVYDSAGPWVLEFDGHGEARKVVALEAFERSEHGQRFAKQLAAALKQVSKDV